MEKYELVCEAVAEAIHSIGEVRGFFDQILLYKFGAGEEDGSLLEYIDNSWQECIASIDDVIVSVTSVHESVDVLCDKKPHCKSVEHMKEVKDEFIDVKKQIQTCMDEQDEYEQHIKADKTTTNILLKIDRWCKCLTNTLLGMLHYTQRIDIVKYVVYDRHDFLRKEEEKEEKEACTDTGEMNDFIVNSGDESDEPLDRVKKRRIIESDDDESDENQEETVTESQHQ